MKDEKQVTLFMLVTDRDCVIADYSIRSYRKIYRRRTTAGYQDFTLFIYLNCLSEENKRRYRGKWESYPYTTLFDNAGKISAAGQPYPGQQIISPEGIARSCDDYAECYDELWTTELRKFDTPFIATVDADFEVLNADVYFYLLSQLREHPDYIAASSCYSGTAAVYDTYSKRQIVLSERNHTWFCIYRKEAFAISAVSHFYYETRTTAGGVLAYDSAAYFQHDLRKNHGYKFAVLPDAFKSSYIHYGAASKNKSLNSRNTGFYRRACILCTAGLIYGNKNRLAAFVNKATRKIAGVLFRRYLIRIAVERSTYAYA